MHWQFHSYQPPTSSTPTSSSSSTPSTNASRKRKRTTPSPPSTTANYETISFSIAPHENTESAIPTIITMSQEDGSTLVEADFTGNSCGFHNFVQVDGECLLVPTVDQLPEANQSTTQGCSIIDTFTKLMEPFFNLLLRDMNNRREKRIVERNKEKLPNQRGRPITTNTQSTSYRNAFKNPFTMKELKAFLSCFYMITAINSRTMTDYWQLPSTTTCGHGQWFNVRISKRKFDEIFHCLEINIVEWIEKLNEQFQKFKKPAKVVCVDESMVPYRGRFNPHFIFIPRKPHPYGIKFETIADSDSYLFKMHMHRRTIIDIEKPILARTKRPTFERENYEEEEEKTVAEIVLHLCSDLGGRDHIVVGDKWFGSLSVSNELKQLGIDSVLKCMSNRPQELWKKVHSLQPNKYEYKVAQADTDIGSKIYLYSFLLPQSSDNAEKHDNLISTVQFNNYVDKTVLGVSEDKNRVEKNVVIHEVSEFYNKMSSFVDEANRSIMDCYYRHRVMDYTTAILVFFLSLLAHNARILYQNETRKNISQVEFVKKIAADLYPLEEQIERHVLYKLNGGRKNCPVCYWVQVRNHVSPNHIKRKKTEYGCKKCRKPMCKECFNSLHHCDYALNHVKYL